jgi:uncharacterized protein YktA (UPF0223 family)
MAYKDKEKGRQHKKEYMRNKRASDPEWAAKSNQKSNECHRIKYAVNPEWANERRQSNKTYLHNRRKTKPEWVEKEHCRNKEYRRCKQATDSKWVEKELERGRKYASDKRQYDPSFKLNDNIRRRLRYSLKLVGSTKKNKTFQILGYTVEQLKAHLESLFTDGMSWANQGKGGWHIDHKRPISSFKYTSEKDPQFLICWALDNLQPMWATTRTINGVEYLGNLNKSAKILPLSYRTTAAVCA